MRLSGWLPVSRRRSRGSWRKRPRSFCSSSSPGRRPERASSSSCVTGERSSSRQGSRRLRSRATLLDADRVEPGARPRRDPVPLRLERRRRPWLRGRARVPRDEGRRRANGLPHRARRYGPRRMALRHRRGARLRRAARGRAGLVALACALYLGAGLLATWPGTRSWTRPSWLRAVRGTAKRRRATTSRSATSSGSSGTSSNTGGRRGVTRTASSRRSSHAGISPPGRSGSSTGRCNGHSARSRRGTSSCCSASWAPAGSPRSG